MTSSFMHRQTGEVVEAGGAQKIALMQDAATWLFLDGASEAEKAALAAVASPAEEAPAAEPEPVAEVATEADDAAPLGASPDDPASPDSEPSCGCCEK